MSLDHHDNYAAYIREKQDRKERDKKRAKETSERYRAIEEERHLRSQKEIMAERQRKWDQEWEQEQWCKENPIECQKKKEKEYHEYQKKKEKEDHDRRVNDRKIAKRKKANNLFFYWGVIPSIIAIFSIFYFSPDPPPITPHNVSVFDFLSYNAAGADRKAREARIELARANSAANAARTTRAYKYAAKHRIKLSKILNDDIINHMKWNDIKTKGKKNNIYNIQQIKEFLAIRLHKDYKIVYEMAVLDIYNNPAYTTKQIMAYIAILLINNNHRNHPIIFGDLDDITFLYRKKDKDKDKTFRFIRRFLPTDQQIITANKCLINIAKEIKLAEEYKSCIKTRNNLSRNLSKYSRDFYKIHSYIHNLYRPSRHRLPKILRTSDTRDIREVLNTIIKKSGVSPSK